MNEWVDGWTHSQERQEGRKFEILIEMEKKKGAACRLAREP